jgi:GDP-L-fucose synthase
MWLDKSSCIYVAGHRGLVGSAIVRQLTANGFTGLLTATRAELDLREAAPVREFFAAHRPEVVILAAAKVGGIQANASQPSEHLSDNLRIQLNVLDSAHAFDVRRLLFLGSSCVYPKFAEQPITEDALLTGPLEPTNDAYAIAKIAGVLHVQALRRQYGRHYISVMPTNLYGPGDNFDLESSHVLPGIMRRLHIAGTHGTPSVRLWGTGRARREFLHVDDLARACFHVLEHYDDPQPINIGTGSDITIRELAAIIADVVGYTGQISWDAERPDGTPRKLLNTEKLRGLGWAPRIQLRTGIESTYASAQADGRLRDEDQT